MARNAKSTALGRSVSRSTIWAAAFGAAFARLYNDVAAREDTYAGLADRERTAGIAEEAAAQADEAVLAFARVDR